jgi:polysaccharide transporter, PST family
VTQKHILSLDGVVANTLALLAGRGIGVFLSSACAILLARCLGSAQLGIYGAVFGYITLFEWLASFGIYQIVTKEGAINRVRAGEILVAGSLASSVSSILAFGLALIIAPSAKYGGSQWFLVVIAGADILLLAPLRQTSFIFQVDLKQWLSVAIGMSRQILWLLTILGCWVFGLGLPGIFCGRLACSGVEAVVSLLFAFRLTKPHWPQDWSLVTHILKHSWPLAVAALFGGVYYRFDQVLLHAFSPSRDVGNYVASVNLTEVFGVLPVALMSSAYPLLCKASHQTDEFTKYLGFCFRSLISAVFGLCLVVSFAAVPIVRLVYGRDFSGTAPILVVLIWSEVFVFFGVIISNAIIALGFQKYMPISAAGGAILNVGLNLLLIPKWGALGAAWASNVSYAIAVMLAFTLFRATRAITLHGLAVVLRCGVLSGAILLALRRFSMPILVKSSLAVSLYFLGSIILRIVRKEDYEGFLRGAGVRDSL